MGAIRHAIRYTITAPIMGNFFGSVTRTWGDNATAVFGGT